MFIGRLGGRLLPLYSPRHRFILPRGRKVLLRSTKNQSILALSTLIPFNGGEVIDGGLRFAKKDLPRREFSSLISNNPFGRQATLKLSPRGANVTNEDKKN